MIKITQKTCLLISEKMPQSTFRIGQYQIDHPDALLCYVNISVRGKISKRNQKNRMIMFLKKSGRLPMSFQKWHMPTFLSWKMCHSLIRDLLLLFGQRSAAKTLFLFLFQNDQSCDFTSGIGSI